MQVHPELIWQFLGKFSPSDYIAILALIIALGVGAYTVRTELFMAKMATYQRVHEQLISKEVASGRRELLTRASKGLLPPLPQPDGNPEDTEAWDSINQAMAWYDTLGSYYLKRQVPRKVVMAAWYHPLTAAQDDIYRLLDHRNNLGISQPWSSLRELLTATKEHHCTCTACEAGVTKKQQLNPNVRCDCASCQETRSPETGPTGE